MDAADFERASATVLDLLRLMTRNQRKEMGDRIEDADMCLKCGWDCGGWCDYHTPMESD